MAEGCTEFKVTPLIIPEVLNEVAKHRNVCYEWV